MIIWKCLNFQKQSLKEFGQISCFWKQLFNKWSGCISGQNPWELPVQDFYFSKVGKNEKLRFLRNFRSAFFKEWQSLFVAWTALVPFRQAFRLTFFFIFFFYCIVNRHASRSGETRLPLPFFKGENALIVRIYSLKCRFKSISGPPNRLSTRGANEDKKRIK